MEGKLIKIIVLVTNDLSNDQRMIRICTSLSEAGYDVEIIGRELKDSVPLSMKPYRQKRIKLMFNRGVLFYYAINVRFIFMLLFRRYDILYSVDTDTLIAGIKLKILRRKPLIFDAHELFPELPELVHRPLKKKIWAAIEAMGVRTFSDLRITVSQSIVNYYQKKFNRSFTLLRNIPNYSEVDVQKQAIPYILYQGALNVGRGLETLIEAAEMIPIQIKIAGEGDLSESLRSLVKRKGLESKVEFLGKLTPEQLLVVSREAYIGYNVLENLGKSYYYSLSNKTFDYIHAGIPQIMSNFPEYIALNQQYKIGYTIDLDLAKLVEKVIELLENKERYAEFHEANLQASKELQWQLEKAKLLHAVSYLASN